MNQQPSSPSAGGIGFVGALTVAFVVLKLCHVITWSWLWVLSPVWILASVIAAVNLIAWSFVGIVGWILSRKPKPPRK